MPRDRIPAGDVKAIREAAHTIRQGTQVGVVTIGFAMTPEQADKHLSGPGLVEVATTWQLNIFGLEIPLGKLSGTFTNREVGVRRDLGDGKIAIDIESVGDATLQLERSPELDTAA